MNNIVKIISELYHNMRNADTDFVLHELEQCRIENQQPVSAPIQIAKFIDEKYYISRHRMQYFEIFSDEQKIWDKQKLIIYLHGGAYIYQPVDAHWNICRKLARTLNCKVVFPIYLKSPEFDCEKSINTLLSFYAETILSQTENETEIIIMGDSAGGSIALSLAQLIKQHQLCCAKHIIMFSPSVDMSFSRENESRARQALDPMLQIERLKIIRKSWLGNLSAENPLASPIFGELSNLGQLTLFTGMHEILYPDARHLKEKAELQNIKINYFEYPDMFHDFVLFPIPEAKDALTKVIEIVSY